MKPTPIAFLSIAAALVSILESLPAQSSSSDVVREGHFASIDVFGLEYASDPRISPDGERIVYQRNFFDIMKDRRRSNLWIIAFDGSDQRPLTSGNRNDSSPRWSPDGQRLLYVSSAEGSTQLYVRWMDTGQVAKLSDLTSAPSAISWSPDGEWIAFSMLVRQRQESFAKMPAKPDGAEWAKPTVVIDRLQYRADGAGYLEAGYHHLFVLPAEGGTPRQVTSGPYNHASAPVWTPSGKSLVFSANRHEDWEYDGMDTEIYGLELANGAITALTTRHGPDQNPVVSPDGRRIAYLGFDDHLQGYQVTKLYVMNRDGSGSRLLSGALDRDVQSPRWSADGSVIYFQYDDEGEGKIAQIHMDGSVEDLASEVGGTSLGRPYSGGSASFAKNGRYVYTHTDPSHPADLAVGDGSATAVEITALNADLFGHKRLGAVEEFWYESAFDQRKIQAWIVKPPDFDPNRKYPMILEIHGGPFANYGYRFSAEDQLYAAAGYVVVYANPRGSTSYGAEFGNLIHHNYPGEDYDDLMSAVDAVLARGYVDAKQLFVTGGSGGGVLSSWIVGKTDRFLAAVVAKPVINWYSFVLTADAGSFFYKYWFPGFPWDHQDQYMRRSPISLVGNVRTPTMLMSGEVDYRTPISEAEQFYMALKLRKIDTALVRIPGASHGITRRPSNLIAKVVHILQWFQDHRER